MMVAGLQACLTFDVIFVEEFHKECGPSCVPGALARLTGVYNPLAVPLLNGWTRSVYVLACTVVCVTPVCIVCVHARMCYIYM